MWILMQQSKEITIHKGVWIYGFLIGWKGIVRDFTFGVKQKAIKEVLMQHVYMHKDLHIDPESSSLPLHLDQIVSP